MVQGKGQKTSGMTREMRKMFTKSQISAALATLGLLGSLDAGAFAINPYVPVEFDFNLWNASTVSYSAGSAASDTALCTTGSLCDTAAGQPGGAGTAPNAFLIPGLGYEDEWGIGNIQAITDQDTGDTLWASPVGGAVGERLTAMIYGIVDDIVTYTGIDTKGNQSFETLAKGGRVDIYLRTAAAGVNVSGGPSARTSLASYPTATDGILFLSLAFRPGVVFGDTTHTFLSTFSTGSVAGLGNGYLDVVGGDYASAFNTNTIEDPNGGLHDFSFDVTINTQNVSAGWTVRAQGQAIGETPLPGTLLLLGGGFPALLGMIGLRRRNRST